MNTSSLRLTWLALTVLAVAGCGGGDDAVTEVRDNTAQVEAYYRDNPDFFSFKTLDDLPEGLVWEDGMDLPDLG